jgi:hypothetical protein
VSERPGGTTHLGERNYPVVVADREETLERFMPWAAALETGGRGKGDGGGMILDCAPRSESSGVAQTCRTREARADGDVGFLSRCEATRRESPVRGGAVEPGQPKKV